MSDFFSNLLADAVWALLAFVIGTVYILHRDKIRKVTQGKVILSPNGSKVMYESDGELHVTDSKSGLHHLVKGNQNKYPTWSLDSKYVAFSSFIDKKSWDVWVVNVQTGKANRLTTAPGPERPISWNDNGDLLISMGGSVLWIGREEIEKRVGQ